MMLGGLCVITFTHGGDAAVTALNTGIEKAFSLILTLCPVMCFYTGLMEIAQMTGITKIISRLLSPVTSLLFSKKVRYSPAMDKISMNMSANILGMSGATTPMGIKAIKELEKYKGLFAVKSFNPNIVKRVSVLRPDYIVGVLCTREPSKIAPKIVSKLMNVFAFKLYVPFNFLSVRVKDLPINYKMIKKYNIIAWTIKSEEDLKIAEKYAKNIIFEKTIPTLSKFGEKRF
jgi:hypothetical protein